MKGSKCHAIVLALPLFAPALFGQTTGSSVSYSMVDRGSVAFETEGGTTPLIPGYAKVQPASGTGAPVAAALFGLRQNGVLVTEAGVSGVQPIFNGTTFAEINGRTTTGIAVANPSSASTVISFVVRNAGGFTVRQGTFTLGPNAQTAAFLNESPFNMAGPFTGTLEFDSPLSVGVIALRTTFNERSEFLVTSQTVATGLPSTNPVVLAEFADGGGWRTQVQLVNATDFAITGAVQFFSQGSATVAASAVGLTVNNQFNTTFSYNIAAHAAVNLQTAGTGAALRVGSVRITPSGATSSPSAMAVFSYTQNGILVTEASVPGQPAGTAHRMYAEASRKVGVVTSLQSGVAITNTSSTAATVNFELRDPDGSSAGMTALRVIPAFGQRAEFVRELFPTLPDTFQGVLRITSLTPIAVIGLRSRYNERSEFLITTMPVSDETRPSPSGDVIFPHIVDSGGYSTQFVLFSGVNGQSANGAVRFFRPNGQQLNLTTQ